MKKVLIFGGNGFVGSHLKGERSSLRVNKLHELLVEIKRKKPEVIINCIGRTGENNTDDCDQFPTRTLEANTFVPFLFAEAAIRTGVKLVHVSSGCMFHGSEVCEIGEWENPNFFHLFYSRTKIYAEASLTLLASSRLANILIVRPRIPFFNAKHPKDILYKIQRFKKVIDFPNSMTYLPDFAKAVSHLIDIDARGVYNIVNPKPLTYASILQKFFKRRVPEMRYQDLPMPRTNLKLSCKKLIESGFEPMSTAAAIQEGLKRKRI